MDPNKKIAEGQEYVLKAEKSMKTTLLKWRPDYESAADEYSKAATAFRLAKSFEKCKECLQKANECHQMNKSWFHAAKCYEQIVHILKELGHWGEIEKAANRACNLYMQHGSQDAAAMALDKAGGVIERQLPEAALRLYQRAFDISQLDDASGQTREYASKVSRSLVKLRRYDEATKAICKEIELYQQTESYGHIGRLTVALILVQIARDDVVAAGKFYNEWGKCCEPQEVETIELLLQALDEQDLSQAARALASPFIRHMDVEYAILSTEIANSLTSKSPRKQNIPDSASNEVDALSDDHGLC